MAVIDPFTYFIKPILTYFPKVKTFLAYLSEYLKLELSQASWLKLTILVRFYESVSHWKITFTKKFFTANLSMNLLTLISNFLYTLMLEIFLIGLTDKENFWSRYGSSGECCLNILVIANCFGSLCILRRETCHWWYLAQASINWKRKIYLTGKVRNQVLRSLNQVLHNECSIAAFL